MDAEDEWPNYRRYMGDPVILLEAIKFMREEEESRHYWSRLPVVAVKGAPENIKTVDFMRSASLLYPHLLEIAPHEVKDDPMVLLEAVSQGRGAFMECREHASKRLQGGDFEGFLRGAISSCKAFEAFLFGVGLKPAQGAQPPAASKLRPSARIPKEHSEVVKGLIASFAGVRLGRIWAMVAKESAALMDVVFGHGG